MVSNGDDMAAGIDLLDEFDAIMLNTPPRNAQRMRTDSSERCKSRPINLLR